MAMRAGKEIVKIDVPFTFGVISGQNSNRLAVITSYFDIPPRRLAVCEPDHIVGANDSDTLPGLGAKRRRIQLAGLDVCWLTYRDDHCDATTRIPDLRLGHYPSSTSQTCS